MHSLIPLLEMIRRNIYSAQLPSVPKCTHNQSCFLKIPSFPSNNEEKQKKLKYTHDFPQHTMHTFVQYVPDDMTYSN